MPVLDGYLAMAFGYSREAFSVAGARRDRIHAVVNALADWLGWHSDEISDLRSAVRDVVPTIASISDFRLLAIVLWTAQDERLTRPGRPASSWGRSPA